VWAWSFCVAVPLAASIEQLYPPQAVPSSFTSGNLLDTQPVSHTEKLQAHSYGGLSTARYHKSIKHNNDNKKKSRTMPMHK